MRKKQIKADWQKERERQRKRDRKRARGRKRDTKTKRWRKGKRMRENEPANLRASQRIHWFDLQTRLSQWWYFLIMRTRNYFFVRLYKSHKFKSLQHRRIYENLLSVNGVGIDSPTENKCVCVYLCMYSYTHLIIWSFVTVNEWKANKTTATSKMRARIRFKPIQDGFRVERSSVCQWFFKCT